MSLENNAVTLLQRQVKKYLRKRAAIQKKIQKEKDKYNAMTDKIEGFNLKIIKMQKEADVVLMAIAGGKQTNEGEGFKKTLFTGITPVKVLCVNPDKKELEAIYGRELEKTPEYLSADEAGIKKVRFDFIVQTVINDKLGVNVEVVDKVSYFLEDKPNVSQFGKFQVINLYGETTWATKEEIQSKKLPENMAFYDTTGMRAAFKGEIELVDFLRAFLCIPKKQFYNKNAERWENIKDISQAELQLDDIKKYFLGNISEISSVVKQFAENKVKIPAGVKTTDDNKQYQAWFTQGIFSYKYGERNQNGVISTNYEYAAKIVKEKQDNGSYSTVDFGPADFKFRLYNNEPTVFAAAPQGAMPFDDPFDTAINTGVKANAPVDDSWFNS